MSCASCGRCLPVQRIGGDPTAVHDYLCELQRGKWRQDFDNVCDLSICDCDIRIQRVDVDQWSASHLTQRQLSRRFGLARWKNVAWEFLPLRSNEKQQSDIYGMYRRYMCTRQGPDAVLPYDRWLCAKCTSVIGSISPVLAQELEQIAAGEPQQLDKSSLVGSGFGLLRLEGDLLAVITLDFFGDRHQQLGMGAKVFWLDADSNFEKSLVDLIMYKTIALAKVLGCSKLLLGGSDPKNARHVYKFHRLREGSEFLCEQGWIPINDCLVFGDDSCTWSPEFSRLQNSPK